MLLDAYAAEQLRLSRARGLLFWGFLLVPIMSLVFSVIGTLISLATRSRLAIPLTPVDLPKMAAQAMTSTDLIPVQLFFILAAAALVADDYRWETWRLATPRNTRRNLLLAKLATFGTGAAAGIALLSLASVFAGLIDGVATGAGFHVQHSFAENITRWLGSFAISWLELTAMGALAMLIVVLTRNAIPAVIGALGLWAVQLFAIDRIANKVASVSELRAVDYAFLPAFSADVLRGAVLGGATEVPPAWPLAFLFLALWIALFAAAGVWVFERQDLTRE
jgi:ABC-2 type transport system permease protein